MVLRNIVQQGISSFQNYKRNTSRKTFCVISKTIIVLVNTNKTKLSFHQLFPLHLYFLKCGWFCNSSVFSQYLYDEIIIIFFLPFLFSCFVLSYFMFVIVYRSTDTLQMIHASEFSYNIIKFHLMKRIRYSH